MNTETSLHPTDASLLSYLDDELNPIDARHVDEHLTACEVCRESIEAFRQSSSDITEWLGALEAPVSPESPISRRRITAPRLAIVTERRPIRWYRRPSLRAALVVIGIGAATLTVAPVRGWVVDFVRTIGVPPTPSSEMGSPVLQADATSSGVSFVPVGEDLTIDVAHPQDTGVLTVRLAEGLQVSGRVTGAGLASLMVAGNALRIINDETSTASYEIAIPLAVRHVTVRVGGRVILTTLRSAIADSGAVTPPLRLEPLPNSTNP